MKMAKKKDEKLKEKKIDWRYNLSEYWDALRKYRGLVFLLLGVVFLIEITRVIPNFLFKELVDRGTLFVNGSLGLVELKFVFLVLAVLYILSQIIQVSGFWFRNLLDSKIQPSVMKDLKMKYFSHIVGLDQKFHSSHKTGSLISRMSRGIASVERIGDAFIYNFISPAIQLVIVGISIAYFDWVAGLVIMGIIGAFIVYSYFYHKKQTQLKVNHNDAEDKEKAGLADVFTNISSVRYFGKENYVNNYFGKLARKTQDATYKFWRSYAPLTTGQMGIVSFGTIALLVFPIFRFMNGALTTGEIVFIYTTYRNLMGPVWDFVRGMQSFHQSMIDFQSLFEYGKVEKSVKDKIGAQKMNVKKGEIEFRDIDFGYGKRKKIFKDFDLIIPSKNKVAFVGHSGCGKSTLVNLLYRFYDVDKGAVLIDGEDVRDFRQESLRGAMSIVPQECVLFDDTIWNNIKFSRPSATNEEVWKAIRFAQLDKVIDGMSKKERTIVGERGVKLSGGEKQRVSIARALLSDKKILVLDEATSALDSETEYEIQKSLAKLMKGRTSIIIAHRLSTIMHADLIVVMKKGRIVEMGSHGALLRKKSEYCRLWKLQKGGYIK